MNIGDTGLDHNIPNLDAQMKRLNLNASSRYKNSDTANSFGILAQQAEAGRNPFYRPNPNPYGGKKSRTNKKKISKKVRKNQKRFTKRKY
jgi:hypothetical protein